jgi:uncharacterized protein with WD repeat
LIPAIRWSLAQRSPLTNIFVKEKVMTQSNSAQNLAVFDNVVTAMAISLDGRQVIAGLGNGELQRLDLVSGKPIGKPFQIDEGEVKAVAFSPDDKYIVSAGLKASEGFEAIIRLWNTQGDSIGDPLGEYDGYVVTSVAFSPDSKYIACGGTDTKIRLWDTMGSPIGQPFGESFRPIKSLAFSPDGKHIVSGAYRTVRLWDTMGNRTGGLFQGHDSDVNSVTFSPNGQYIASGGDVTVQLWDTTGNPIGGPFRGHEDTVLSVAFSPDSKYVASGGMDETARLWDLQGNLIAKLERQGDFVSSLSFTPDGQSDLP